MAQVTKRCHWVPQSYLRSFAEKESGKIWRLGKDQGEPELKRLDKVAVRFHVYAPMRPDGRRYDALEKTFADLENYFGDPVWKELATGYVDLSWRPLRKMVALLAATTWLRTPTQFENHQRTHRRIRRSFLSFPRIPEEVMLDRRQVGVDTASWPSFGDATDEDIKADWNDSLSQSSEIAKLFLDTRWAMVVDESGRFVTSDNPVMVGDTLRPFKGLNHPEAMVTFPISLTRVLVMDRRHGETDSAYYTSSGPHATNMLTWRNSIAHLFSPRHPYEICEEIASAAEAAGFGGASGMPCPGADVHG